MEKKARAIGLLSGGLDSLLAAGLISEQGIEVEAISFATGFCAPSPKDCVCVNSKKAAERVNIQIKVIDVSEEYLDIVKNPRYGYGSGMNPCIDCRIFMLKKAKEYMDRHAAAFIFTGEVLGQRPMSQRKGAIGVIERDSGLEGYIVRPLSAKLMPPTIPEKEGVVDRERLLAISGRSRSQQILLAGRFGIEDYPNASGGCLLTDRNFSARLKDLLKHRPDFGLADARLLKYGRHFRLSPKVKLVVGRDERENAEIADLKRQGDILFYADEPKGPLALLGNASDGEFIEAAASIVARYALGKAGCGAAKIRYQKCPAGEERHLEAEPLEELELNRIRI